MNGESVPNWLPVDPNFATAAIHSGYIPKDWTYAPVVPAISLSTTFEQEGPAQHRGFEYSRSGNPTRQILEGTLAALDKGKHGLVFSSGLAATTNLVAMLNNGDRILSMDDVYGGTGRLFRQMKKTANIETDFVDLTNLTEVKAALTEKTKMVWIETPTNPTLKVVDIAAVANLAHAFSKDIIVIVDNTFLTSYFQRPLSFGADIAVYSLTKYVNGHSDVLMGAVVTNNDDLKEKLTFLQNSSHPKVDKVLHPGLSNHPQHELALKQCSGHSGLISFYMKSGDSSAFLKNLKVFSLAESLGGYESLAELPFSMTHASVPADLRAKLGITENFIRLSVGLESVDDLITDLDVALNTC